MKVKVTKSGTETYWYNNEIGNTFEVEVCKLIKNRYTVLDDVEHTDRLIAFDDCVLV